MHNNTIVNTARDSARSYIIEGVTHNNTHRVYVFLILYGTHLNVFVIMLCMLGRAAAERGINR